MRTRWFFGFFLVSGFCSLVCEIVWLRLAMASFGVTTPIVSMVLSIFMGGLALGSWAAGRLTARLRGRSASAPLRWYAGAEIVIGASGFIVPPALAAGHAVLARSGGGLAWGSAGHHLAAGAWIALVVLPFATAMGATFPLAMAAMKSDEQAGATRSFSYLYLANVLGATAGTALAALFLIEILGFHGTLMLTAILNLALAATVLVLSGSGAGTASTVAVQSSTPAVLPMDGFPASRRATLGLLFLTGLTSMALEVVWIRLLTPYLGTIVYAFALILTIYLLATFLGSAAYRRGMFRPEPMWAAAGCLALIALAAADWRLGKPGTALSFMRAVVAVGPFSLAVGYLTPLLVDRWSAGAPERAGSAYAVNVLGCILGPLLASFLLLPSIGERWASLALAAPLFLAGLFATLGDRSARAPLLASSVVAVLLLSATRDYETSFPHTVVRRDSTATVIATGEGMEKQLRVNGYGMTMLTTITKTIAHLPLALLPERPQKVLVICFGMGTSFRSALTWGVDTTTVELIPSVPKLFGYFHANAASVLADPSGHIVVDDGRRFLERTADTFDVITIDPPPPVEAAGSSLLYSREFYAAARRRLKPGGILHQWYPGTEDNRVNVGVVRAIQESFPHVRAFPSLEGWGIHLVASERPLPPATGTTLAAKLPPAALADLLEWLPGASPERVFDAIVSGEMSLDTIIALAPTAPALTDDRPLNEYYLLHRTLD